MTPDEAELWRQLAHSIDRVKAKPRVTGRDAPDATPASGPAPAPLRAKRTPAHHRPAASLHPPPPAKAQAPRPAELDRRTLRQVAAGKVPIDASLDLHGLHQAAAHARLRAFLVSCQANGHRMVLVITGKGGAGTRPLAADLRSYRDGGGERPDPASRGVLRRCVPQWLDKPEFRAIVLGYAAAGVRHGGEGALYIRLRKARDA